MKYFINFSIFTILFIYTASAFGAAEPTKLETPLSADEKNLLTNFRQEAQQKNTTPLLIALAAYQEQPSNKIENIIGYLIETETETINIPNKEGKLPAEFYVNSSLLTAVLFIRTLDIYLKNNRFPAEKVLAHVFNNLVRDWDAQARTRSVMETLLEMNPDIINNKFMQLGPLGSEEGDTPLHFAVKNNRLDLIDWLLSHNAQVNIFNKYGTPPLYFIKSIKALDALLQAGADITHLLYPYKYQSVHPAHTWLDNKITGGSPNSQLIEKVLAALAQKVSRTAFTHYVNSLGGYYHLYPLGTKEFGEFATSTPLCMALRSYRSKPNLELNNLIRILFEFGARCDKPEFQEVLNDVLSQKINFPLQGKQGAIEPEGDVMGLIHEYTGAIPAKEQPLPTQEDEEDEKKQAAVTKEAPLPELVIHGLDE